MRVQKRIESAEVKLSGNEVAAVGGAQREPQLDEFEVVDILFYKSIALERRHVTMVCGGLVDHPWEFGVDGGAGEPRCDLRDQLEFFLQVMPPNKPNLHCTMRLWGGEMRHASFFLSSNSFRIQHEFECRNLMMSVS
jgi:hypothetical protein